ncbi:hypothetical protein ES705_06633 [subsurface metagenome]
MLARESQDRTTYSAGTKNLFLFLTFRKLKDFQSNILLNAN